MLLKDGLTTNQDEQDDFGRQSQVKKVVVEARMVATNATLYHSFLVAIVMGTQMKEVGVLKSNQSLV